MRLLELHLLRFGSFREETVFRFPDGPGLYFLQGENGAGKSTLWNALCWVLFDRTVKGLRAGDVANWDDPKGARVAFTYESDDGGRAEIVRQHSPNKWMYRPLTAISTDKDFYFDLTKDETNPVLAELRLGMAPFLNCVLMGQKRPMFIDMSGPDKAALFSEVLGLDDWIARSKEAGARAAAQDKVTRDLESRLARTEGELGAIDLNQFEGSAANWEAERSRRLTNLEELHAQAMEGRKRAKRDYETAEIVQGGDRAVLHQCVDDLDEESRKAPKCPTCGQPIVNRQAKELQAEAEKLRMRFRLSEDALSIARNKLAVIDRDLDRIEEEAERVEKERNPFAAMRQEAIDRQKNLEAQQRALARQLDDSQAQHSILGYWVQGFKEVRLQQIDEALEEFEIEANSNLSELGLHDWEILFEVDKETKSGSVRRGFNEVIRSPDNRDPVPWESWSGGEGQRLSLATQAGLADLIRSRAGVTLALEVWDEPTQHLNMQGVRDLLDALAARAQREKRQVWIVDHRTLGYGGFAATYRVTKDDKGSRVEVQE